MIRYAVATVLLLYFYGADVFRPYRPPFVDRSLEGFHDQINRGVWRIIGPGVSYFTQDHEEGEKQKTQ